MISSSSDLRLVATTQQIDYVKLALKQLKHPTARTTDDDQDWSVPVDMPPEVIVLCTLDTAGTARLTWHHSGLFRYRRHCFRVPQNRVQFRSKLGISLLAQVRLHALCRAGVYPAHSMTAYCQCKNGTPKVRLSSQAGVMINR